MACLGQLKKKAVFHSPPLATGLPTPAASCCGTFKQFQNGHTEKQGEESDWMKVVHIDSGRITDLFSCTLATSSLNL